MINLNGNLQSVNNSISANNRGFLYGDGVFDVIKLIKIGYIEFQ